MTSLLWCTVMSNTTTYTTIRLLLQQLLTRSLRLDEQQIQIRSSRGQEVSRVAGDTI